MSYACFSYLFFFTKQFHYSSHQNLNERGLDKENASNSISVLVTQRNRDRQREMPGWQWEMPGFQREPRELIPQGQTSGWGDGPMGSSSKAPGCFSGGKFWSVPPLGASTNGNAQSPVGPGKGPQLSPMGSVSCIFAQNCFISSTDRITALWWHRSFTGFKDFGEATDCRRDVQLSCLSKVFETGLLSWLPVENGSAAQCSPLFL